MCRAMDDLPQKAEAMANALNQWIEEEGIDQITFVITGTSGAYLISELYQRVKVEEKTVVQVARDGRRKGGHHRDLVEGYSLKGRGHHRVVFVDDQISSGQTLRRTVRNLCKSKAHDHLKISAVAVFDDLVDPSTRFNDLDIDQWFSGAYPNYVRRGIGDDS